MKPLVLSCLFVVATVLPSLAQVTNAPAANATAANPAPAGQAPDEVMKKLSDLVHARKYAEAQQLTAGLLIAYPNDQRLIKAKALIEKLLSPAASASATPGNDQPFANTNAEQLTGMDRIDYNALIQRAREAQQTTDLAQQKVLLKEFMDDSSQFLQKYPDQLLVWQLRAASAISLDDITAGYRAGQKLLAMGAADSNDSNLQQLLAQLKNKGWLGKDAAEKAQKQAEEARTYGWTSGTWNLRVTETDKEGNVVGDSHSNYSEDGVQFIRNGSVLEGYMYKDLEKIPWGQEYRMTILDSGELRCERWVSCEFSDHNRTLTFIAKEKQSHKVIEVFTRIDSAH